MFVSTLPSLYQHLYLVRFSGNQASGDVRLTPGLAVARNVHALYISDCSGNINIFAFLLPKRQRSSGLLLFSLVRFLVPELGAEAQPDSSAVTLDCKQFKMSVSHWHYFGCIVFLPATT